MSEPRHVYVISFDAADTLLYYFCSHSDIVISGVSSSNIFYGDITLNSSKSQTIDPLHANSEIGDVSFSFNDTDQLLSSLLNSKLLAGYALYAKRIQHWRGKKGYEFSSEYTLVNTVQFNGDIALNDFNEYGFTGRDIQRSLLDTIFDQKKTNLTSSISATAITIPALNTTEFLTLHHGSSFSDAPNSTVGYVWIGDETIRWTSKTATTFTVDNESSTLNGAISIGATSITVTDASAFQSSGVGYITDITTSPNTITEIRWLSKSGNILQYVSGVINAHSSGDAIVNATGRGALNTIAIKHDVDSTQADDKKPEITERIYLEMNAVALDYAIKTGTIYNSSPVTTLPSHWTLGISSTWISTSQYTSIGTDIYDPNDETAGLILYFSNLKKTNAKKFCEEQLLFPAGVFSPILNTGELGLKRMTGVISTAPYENVLNEDNIYAISNVRWDQNDVHNVVRIKWNYNAITEEFTRTTEFENTDSSSVDKYGATEPLEFELLGLDGSRHTNALLSTLCNTWFDRHAYPPFKASIEVDSDLNNITVGSVQRLQLNNLAEWTDSNGNYSSIDISVEVQSITENEDYGSRTLTVFGSTGKSGTISLGSDTTVISNSEYSAYGSSLTAYLAAHYSTPADYTDSGGVLTISGNITLPGYTDLTSATALADNDQGVFYYLGDITNNGTINWSDNLQLNIRGTLTNNGTMNASGGGLTASTSGTAGGIGWTKAQGGFNRTGSFAGNYGSVVVTEASIVKGNYDVMPNFLLDATGATNIVENIPTDLRGTSGSDGSDVIDNSGIVAAGGVGGDGGGGLVLVARGIAVGGSSAIILSGTDGTKGASYNAGFNVYQSGTGGGGSPGGLLLIADGTSTIIDSDFESTIQALQGNCPYYGTPVDLKTSFGINLGDLICSAFIGYQTENRVKANYRLIYLQDSQTAASDAPSITSPATAISFVENSNTPSTPAQNLATVDITLTPPSDGNYAFGEVYYKLSTQSDSQFQKISAPALNEVSVEMAMDGSTYIFRTYGVSLSGEVSSNYTQESFTVSSTAGGATLLTGNYIGAGKTSFSDTAAGWFIEKTATGGRAIFGGPSQSVSITDTGSVTMTGSITASSGTIGGFTIGSSSLTAGSGGTAVGLNTTGYPFYAGNSTPASAPFRVTSAGAITSTSGSIGGWTLGSTSLTAGSGATAVGMDSAGINPRFYAGGPPGSAPFEVDSAGALTATSATITGTITTSNITATGGTIGGWTATSTTLYNGDALLDAGNQRIQIGPSAGSYIRLDTTTGVTGVDSILGTIFDLPLDGSAPSFSSGVLNSVTYNLYSASVIRTSTTVGDGSASSQGVLMNDAGIKLFPSSSSTPNVYMDATTGKLTLAGASNIALDTSTGEISINNSTFGNSGIQLQYNSGTPRIYAGDGSNTYLKYDGTNLTVSSLYTSTSGQRIELNPAADNELHFYGDRGDTTIEELATIGINTYGSDGVVGYFGSINSGSSNVGVLGLSNSAKAGIFESASDYGILVKSQTSIGLYATTTSGEYAIYGTEGSIGSIIGNATSGYGLYGIASTGRGVYGNAAGSGVGVLGSSISGYGLQGNSSSSFGLYATTTTGTSSIYADAGSTASIYGATTTTIGVTGYASTSGTGVNGVSSSGYGVQATSISGYGLNVSSSSSYGINATTSTGAYAIYASGGTTAAIRADGGTLWGIYGVASSGHGLHGYASTSGVGVYGISASGNGLYGASTSSVGIQGVSTSSYGLAGQTTTGAYAIYGNGGTIATIYGVTSTANGVYGNATTSGIGVRGNSSSGYGVYGISSSNLGVYASSSSYIALYAATSSTTNGAFKIAPKANTTDPTTGSVGELVVLSNGILRYYGGSGWVTVAT